MNIDASLIAIARGARILEKHFTMSKSMHGPDHSGSMEPLELAEIRRFADSFANILYHPAIAAAAA
jgi:sialic acid synthase SpsE